ncbi:MAG: hypothetical protein CL678_05260 [Bdellovibrionaceae bacterium]|nr:hypothetical protein [Pseudobdellovibrionaceae bacterium]
MKLKTALLILLFSQNLFAVKFANQFVEFELPPAWTCTLEGAEWVCQSANKTKKRDAIIVLAAKLRGEQDSLDQYLAYLKKEKAYKSIQGKPVKSQKKYSKTSSINAHAWVDSLHLESELPGFYTRYLATVKKDIAVLVTYSINKNKYQTYLNDFENMVKTLRVFRKSGMGLNAASANSNLFKNTNIPSHISQGTVFPGMSPQGAEDGFATKKPEDDSLIYLIILLVGLIGFVIWKKKRNG